MIRLGVIALVAAALLVGCGSSSGPAGPGDAVKQLGPLLAAQLTQVKIGAASVHGNSATVPLSTPRKQAIYSLQKTGGRWVISGLTGR